MKKRTNCIFFFFFSSLLLGAQDFSALTYRELGPYRGGRVTAVAGVASQPSTFYQGATGAGVWKTTDYGISWKNISDGFFSTPSIGAIAVAQNDPNIVYVGTGSDGLRSNVIEGHGVYKSIDAGENWRHMGLDHVGQIGAVRIHPNNHNVVYVAAIGKAFRANAERGVFKTHDGGETWQKVLYIAEKVGIYDIELLPSNPEILFATAWKAERKPWTIISGGKPEEGGIYKSIDGGKNWKKIIEGLPKTYIGKIDIAVSPADSKQVYALVEAPGEEGGLYKSVDQGATFKHVSSHKGIRTRPFYYTNLRIDPKNPDVLYALATGYFKSVNGGQSWEKQDSPHGDNHDMWINPENPALFIQSNDGGANVTLNGGRSWSTQLNQPTSEIYQIEVDDQYPYWVYGGQQDNYTTVAVPSQAPYGLQTPGTGYIINTGGCETGPAVPKPGHPNIVYANCKGRFGVFNKKNGTEMQYYVGASNMYGHNPNELTYRFQRVSPIHVSPHDPSIIYHCSQYVHKTTDEGRTWEVISPDLTVFEADKQVISGGPITRDITGEEFYSTIYSIRESPLEKGLIWVGTNDGLVQVTRDGGQTWRNVTPTALPKGGRVDAVEPSAHRAAKAYISILRYQLGDTKPYIYKTDDYGDSWELLTKESSGIPSTFPVRVVREDPIKEGLLFAGTEYGVFLSFSDGKSWQPLQQNLPVTPVSDLKIHRGDLVLSTMGRGFWVLDDISSIRQSTGDNPSEHVLYQPKNTYRYRYPTGASSSKTPKYPQPSVKIDYYLVAKSETHIRLEIENESGEVIYAAMSADSTKADKKESKVERNMNTEYVKILSDEKLTNQKGMNRFKWNMKQFGAWHKEEDKRYKRGPLAPPGTYKAVLKMGNFQREKTFELLMDPRSKEAGVTPKDLKKQAKLQNDIRVLLEKARKLAAKLEKDLETLEKAEIPELESLSKSKALLAEIQTEEGIYMKPMLIDQISYLYYMLNRADQIPGKDAYERYEELKKRFEEISRKNDL